jgi:hypothetical protein
MRKLITPTRLLCYGLGVPLFLYLLLPVFGFWAIPIVIAGFTGVDGWHDMTRQDIVGPRR